MSSTDAPENQTSWHDEKVDQKEPETLFGFADTAVSSSEFEAEDIASFTGPKTSQEDTDEGSDVGDTDERRGEVVGWGSKDKGGRGIEDIEPHQVRAVLEAGPKDDGESKEEEGSVNVCEKLVRFLGDDGPKSEFLHIGLLAILKGGVGTGDSRNLTADFLFIARRSGEAVRLDIFLLCSQVFDVRSTAVVHRLLETEEKDNERNSVEDGAPVENPLPTLTLTDESSNDGSEEGRATEHSHIPSHHGTTFMREPDIGNDDFGQTFDRGSE